MEKIEGMAYLACMFSPEVDSVCGRGWLLREVDKRAQARFDSVVVVPHEVVHARGIELRGQMKYRKDLIFRNVKDGKVQAVILCGDTLTEFGHRLVDSAHRNGVDIYLGGFGSGNLGRLHRAWHGRGALKRHARKNAGTYEAVGFALKEGLLKY